MKIEADEVERYPAAAVNFEDEEGYGSCPGWRRFELSPEEASDLRRARDEWRAWESRLLGMLEPGSPPAGFFS